MALQSLTKVPFRCVDEINQGMDATNERFIEESHKNNHFLQLLFDFRKVFDMLMKTSVQDHQAQYFLLTPKLLPDLHYDVSYKHWSLLLRFHCYLLFLQEGVTVLIVHHGQHLCHFTEWSMKNFLAAWSLDFDVDLSCSSSIKDTNNHVWVDRP